MTLSILFSYLPPSFIMCPHLSDIFLPYLKSSLSSPSFLLCVILCYLSSFRYNLLPYFLSCFFRPSFHPSSLFILPTPFSSSFLFFFPANLPSLSPFSLLPTILHSYSLHFSLSISIWKVISFPKKLFYNSLVVAKKNLLVPSLNETKNMGIGSHGSSKAVYYSISKKKIYSVFLILHTLIGP